nr:hypothetical protein [uncultured Muribaculum sp.]
MNFVNPQQFIDKIDDIWMTDEPLPKLDLETVIPQMFQEAGFTYEFSPEDCSFKIIVNDELRMEATIVQHADGIKRYQVIIYAGDVSSDNNCFEPDNFFSYMPKLRKTEAYLQKLKAKQTENADMGQLIRSYLETHNMVVPYKCLLGRDENRKPCIVVCTELFPTVTLSSYIRTDVPSNYTDVLDNHLRVVTQFSTEFGTGVFPKMDGLSIGYRGGRLANGLNKDYTKETKKLFGADFVPYSIKSQMYKPKSTQLIKTLEKLKLEYGYTDNHEFVIHYPNERNYVLMWNEDDSKFYDIQYNITPKGEFKRRRKSFKNGLVEKLTESEVIKFITLAFQHGAFPPEPGSDATFRRILLIAMTKNIMPAETLLLYSSQLEWSGVGMFLEFAVGLPKGGLIRIR